MVLRALHLQEQARPSRPGTAFGDMLALASLPHARVGKVRIVVM